MENRFMHWKHWEKGTTLIEVIVVICLVSIVMGPMFLALPRLNQYWKDVVSVEDATNVSELLLEEVKDQITSDLALKGSNLASKNQALWDFLEYDEADFKKRYHTDRYIYEVILWPLREKDLLDGFRFEMNPESIHQLMSQPNEQAMVLYSSYLPILEEKIIDSEHQTMSLAFGEAAVRLWQIDESLPKSYLGGSLDEKVNYQVVNTLKIKVKDELNVEEAIQIVEAEENEKEHSVVQIGKVSGWESVVEGLDKKLCREFEIIINANEKMKEWTINHPKTVRYLGKVQIDLSEAARKRSATGSFMSPYLYHFKIVNATGYDQVVQVIDNEVDCQEDLGVSFTLENRKNAVGQIGKSYLQTQSSMKEANYLIALWIGEVKPNKDGKCKIIKKMLDIYSYDSISKEGD